MTRAKENNINITLEQIKQILEENFTPPFLEEGMVKAKFVEPIEGKEKTLQINIGRRDIWLNEKGEVTAAGTCAA